MSKHSWSVAYPLTYVLQQQCTALQSRCNALKYLTIFETNSPENQENTHLRKMFSEQKLPLCFLIWAKYTSQIQS